MREREAGLSYLSLVNHIFLYVLILLFCYTLIHFQFTRPFGWDELEHIHSTYLVSQGFVPYRDFFEHHHPLLWYCFSPIFWIFGTNEWSLITIKLITLIIGFLNLSILFRISRCYFKRPFQLITILIVGSSVIFLSNGIELRPDNLMLTFLLSGYYFLLKRLNLQKKSLLLVSGICVGIAFLFLQKALFFILSFNLYLLLEDLSIFKDFSISSFKVLLQKVVSFNIGIGFPILLFLVIIFASGIFDTYYFFNWTLNLYFDDKFSVLRTLGKLNFIYLGFLVFLVPSLIWLLIHKIIAFSNRISPASLGGEGVNLDSNRRSLLLLITNLFIILSLVLVRSPYLQYFLPIIFFGSIVIVIALGEVQSLYGWKAVLPLAGIACLPLFYPPYPFSRDYTFAVQKTEIGRVGALSEDQKKDLKIQEEKNLFYTKHPYYWFSPEAESTVKKLKNNRHRQT